MELMAINVSKLALASMVWSATASMVCVCVQKVYKGLDVTNVSLLVSPCTTVLILDNWLNYFSKKALFFSQEIHNLSYISGICTFLTGPHPPCSVLHMECHPLNFPGSKMDSLPPWQLPPRRRWFHTCQGTMKHYSFSRSNASCKGALFLLHISSTP